MKTNTRSIAAVLTAAGSLMMGSATNAATYDVGPNNPITTLSAVPWSALQPGDTVNIHWRAQPYREHILLSQSGTAAQHIVVRGIADPQTHQLPVIDADQAVEAANIDYINPVLWGVGAVVVSPRATGYQWGYIPSYIDIESLKVVNARQPLAFTAPDGTVRNYARFSSAVYIERGDHIAIRNCELTASGLGLFANSKFGTAALTSNLLIEHNDIHHNGVINDYSCHNCYTEGAGVTYQYNHIGPVINGSYADAIKDRSSGLVVRYNNIESGPGDCFDLIEAQSDPYIATLPNYDKTWIYGNTFYNGPTGAVTLIVYGGLDIDYSMYRRGTLFFYNNTVINQQPFNAWWRSSLFELPLKYYTNQASVEKIDCRNNIIYNVPVTPGTQPGNFYLVTTDNTPYIDLNANYLSPGVQTVYNSGNGVIGGSITGWANQMFGDANGLNNPGFVNSVAGDYRLANSSFCIDKGVAQHPLIAGVWDPLYELQSDLTVTNRQTLGSAIDLGAHENSGLPAVPLVSINNVSQAEGNSGTKNMIFTVSLATVAQSSVSVDYTTINGTAKAGTDFVQTSGTLTIPAGQTTATIAVPIYGNTLFEADKTFTVALGNPVNAALLSPQGVGTIVNDDAVAQVSAPIITSFTPGNGAVGSKVTLTGQYFTGATTVALHDVACVFTVVNDTTITLTVPAMASGPAKVKVITPAGKGWAGPNFIVN